MGFNNIQGLSASQNRRISQRNILPQAVKGRNLNQSMFVVTNQSSFTPATFGNGSALRLTSVTTEKYEQPILLEKYWSAYIGAITETNNIFNNSLDTSGLIIRGPMYDEMRWSANGYTTASTLVIQNVSAGTITVSAFVREKLITISPNVSTT